MIYLFLFLFFYFSPQKLLAEKEELKQHELRNLAKIAEEIKQDEEIQRAKRLQKIEANKKVKEFNDQNKVFEYIYV